MDLLPGDRDLDQARRGVLVSRPVPDHALGQGPDVHPERHRRDRVTERARVEHRLRAADLADRGTLLCGLEHEQHRAREPVPDGGQDVRAGQHRRGVAIVAARVSHRERATRVIVVDDRGREVDAGFLPHGQRVHVGPERRYPLRAVLPAGRRRLHGRRCRSGPRRALPRAVARLQTRPCAPTVGQFRVRVQVMPPRDQPVTKTRRRIVQSSSPVEDGSLDHVHHLTPRPDVDSDSTPR